jgi:hypothetical protein
MRLSHSQPGSPPRRTLETDNNPPIPQSPLSGRTSPTLSELEAMTARDGETPSLEPIDHTALPNSPGHAPPSQSPEDEAISGRHRGTLELSLYPPAPPSPGEEELWFVWCSRDADAHWSIGPRPVTGVDEDEEDQWEVEEVLGSRRDANGDFQYLIRYRGHSGIYWQDLSDVLDAPKARADFHHSQPAASQPNNSDWDQVRVERPDWRNLDGHLEE